MKIQIDNDNYEHYKKIFQVIQSHLVKLYPPGMKRSDPIEILNSWELNSKAVAKKGLTAGLQDTISQIKNFPPDTKSAIDADLALNHLPALNELEDAKGKAIARILKGQKIKSLEEFYLATEEVSDLNSSLTASERAKLDQLLFQFAKPDEEGIE